MAELKRNFLKARMNKDLDERLIPNGEYRHALNIEISSSDTSEVGSAQTINGNYRTNTFAASDLSLSQFENSSQTVGVFTDVENNHIYNFVHGISDLRFQDINLADGGTTKVRTGQKSDAILRYTPQAPSLTKLKGLNYNSVGLAPEGYISEVVIHDVYEVRTRSAVATEPGEHSKNSINFGAGNSTGVGKIIHYELENGVNDYGDGQYKVLQNIRPGMRVQAIDLAGNDVYGGGNEIIVTKIKFVGNNATVFTNQCYGVEGLYTKTMQGQGVVLKFTSERILNFRSGDSKELEINNFTAQEYHDYKKAENKVAAQEQILSNRPSKTYNTFTPKNSYISSISLIDDFLFWTDGRNEPKKINVKRCILGNPKLTSVFNSANLHFMYRPHTMLIVKVDNRFFPTGYLLESHITTLKPNPCNALTAIGATSSDNSLPNVPLFGGAPGDVLQPFNLNNNSNEPYGADDLLWVSPVVSLNNPWDIGTVLVINAGGHSTQIQIEDIIDNTGASNINYSPSINQGYYVVSLVGGAPEDYPADASNETWFATVKVNDGIYSQDFISFSYRYIYTDKENSCLAPFTPAVFNAGNYAYSPKDGYNLGMQNNIEEILIKDFYNENIPKDVVAIEFVFKSQKSENVYSFKTIKRSVISKGSNAINTLVSTSSGYQKISFETDNITISKKLFGYTLPSDQLTRVFDAVPKKAVAQEIQANRLMYANYTQDYNLIDATGNYIKPEILPKIRNLTTGFETSFDSLNTMEAKSGTFFALDEDPLSATVGQNISFNDPTEYSQTTQVGGQFGITEALRASVEISDPGNNFENSVYEAPVTGFYTISAKANVKTRALQPNAITRPQNSRLRIQKVANNLSVPTSFGDYYTDVVAGSANSQFTATDGGYTYGPPGNEFFAPYGGSVDFPGFAYDIEINQTVHLEQGDFIALFAISDEPLDNSDIWGDSTPVEQKIKNVSFKVTTAPSSEEELTFLKGQKSLKSDRNYNIGIVYRDFLGRESSVLISENNDVFCKKQNSSNVNVLSLSVASPAPAWAKTYKYFIKENTSKHENLVLEGAFLADSIEGDYAYLVFNSVDKDKVKTGDYLVAKKQQNTNLPITDLEAKYRVVSIIGEEKSDDDSSSLVINETNIPAQIVATADQLDGKFFVKVINKNLVGGNNVLGNVAVAEEGEVATILSNGSLNGAVFETESDSTVDLDLYYEISDAIPINLTYDLAEKYIKKEDRVVLLKGYSGDRGIFDVNSLVFPRVVSVRGSITKGALQNSNNNNFAYCEVLLDQESDVNIPALTTSGFNLRLRFKTSETKYVEAYLAKDIAIGDNHIYILPDVHDAYLNVAPGFYNCISFGNGVESDTIRDDFNAAELFKYTAAGKQSGIRANVPSDKYEEYTKPSDIIFSEIYNETRSSNRFNEFLLSKNIVKQINPDYGSIQKLFSRNNDLLTFCEKKCLKILSQKDALFNADGNSQLLSTDKVLGQAIPFAGDYGISKNPESFAVDEFRCYFTDIQRGAVLRLSKDGITPISNVGMKDWFSDHFPITLAAIGSFDSTKEEYNITLHEVFKPNTLKLVHTISFSENVTGWTSFKSFIQEAGVSLNNNYYTFKKGSMWDHNAIETPLRDVDGNVNYLPQSYNQNPYTSVKLNETGYGGKRNNFYGIQYNSEINIIFNDNPDIVKTFRYFDYEGDQALVEPEKPFFDIDFKDYTMHLNYLTKSMIDAKMGWYCEYISTDIQDAGRTYFVEKEGKWFSYIKGAKTKHTNLADLGNFTSSNIDFKENSVQGLGTLTQDPILIDGTMPELGYNIVLGGEVVYASDSDDESDPPLLSDSISTSGSINLGFNTSSGSSGGY